MEYLKNHIVFLLPYHHPHRFQKTIVDLEKLAIIKNKILMLKMAI
jgi:hypothetical protein